MMDSGGNSGVLRDTYGVLPPGDLRRCLIALSDESQMLRDILSYRFEEPPLTGHNLGNLFFLALTLQPGSEKLAIESIGKMLKIKGCDTTRTAAALVEPVNTLLTPDF